MTEKNDKAEYSCVGNIKISDDVIASIAALAVEEIDGVSLLSASPGMDMKDLLWKKQPGRGVKVQFAESGVTLELQVLVRYGTVVAELAQKVQEAVAVAVESMTALHVDGVNVSVAGISLEKGKPGE